MADSGAQSAFLKAFQPAVALAAAAGIAVLLLAWSGVRTQRTLATRQADLRRAEATLADFADLRRRYAPAVAAESIAWRRSWLQLQELGVVGDQRLELTRRVARTAEAAGLRGVRVHIEPPDTVGLLPRLSTEGVQSPSAPFSLRVECTGGLASVISFLGQLPPAVAPLRLSLVRQDERGPHRIVLAVYELTFTNGAPSGWTSLERGHADPGSPGRPGG